MGRKSVARPADRLIAELAARQHGVVARWQLLAAGITARQINLRLKGGRLHQIHHGVYLVGHAVPPPLGREQAALLACGRSAVLSHRTAAHLWNLFPYPASAPVCVAAPPERGTVRPGIRAHRATLSRRDVRHHRRLALTSPPRTILDLAHELIQDNLEQLVAEGAYRRLASEQELHDQLERNPGKRGNAKIRAVLDLPGGPRRTRSRSEPRMLRLLRDSGLDGYEINGRVYGYEVDVLWRELNFAVEVDGYDAHSGRVPFERDRLKIATLQANGVGVMPITGRQLRDDRAGVEKRLLRGLERAGYRLTLPRRTSQASR
jgi:very-short-patch-repair endonuclease